eukprot:6218082-Amphidinium_carterae.1
MPQWRQTHSSIPQCSQSKNPNTIKRKHSINCTTNMKQNPIPKPSIPAWSPVVIDLRPCDVLAAPS